MKKTTAVVLLGFLISTPLQAEQIYFECKVKISTNALPKGYNDFPDEVGRSYIYDNKSKNLYNVDAKLNISCDENDIELICSKDSYDSVSTYTINRITLGVSYYSKSKSKNLFLSESGTCSILDIKNKKF